MDYGKRIGNVVSPVLLFYSRWKVWDEDAICNDLLSLAYGRAENWSFAEFMGNAGCTFPNVGDILMVIYSL